jgi:hypothetical protein
MCAWWMLIASSTQIPRTSSSRTTSPTQVSAATVVHVRAADQLRAVLEAWATVAPGLPSG